MLNTLRKAAQALAAVAVMIASISLATATPAAAAGATSCPSDGYITRWDRCTSLSNGVLSLRTVSAGNYITVNYYRSSGSSLSAKLGYERSGSSVYSSYINMSTTPFHYERSWSVSASCAVVYGKLLTSGGTLYVTPAADPC
ncbi:hypothetical protein [Streptomyces broussonetiae]|uniref:Uncharacterized protein n=1 Tax=Streptomyces broussonetiae TaxID=2686304 RepID=A0ABV5E3P9_9ACTN